MSGLKTEFDKPQVPGSIAEKTHTLISEELDKLHPGNGVSQSSLRCTVRRVAKFVISTKDVGMAFARLESQSIASVILASVYLAAQLVDQATDEVTQIIEIATEIPEIMMVWMRYEEVHMTNREAKDLHEEYKNLQDEIVKMYTAIIVLLGKLQEFLHKKWRKFYEDVSAFLHAHCSS